MEDSISVNRMLKYAFFTFILGIGVLYYRDQQEGLEQARETSRQQQVLIDQQNDKLRRAEEQISDLQKASVPLGNNVGSTDVSSQQNEAIRQRNEQIEELKKQKTNLQATIDSLKATNGEFDQILADSLRTKDEQINRIIQEKDSIISVKEEFINQLQNENQNLRAEVTRLRKQTGEVVNLVRQASNAEIQADLMSNPLNINKNKKYKLYEEAARIYTQLYRQYQINEAEEQHHRVLKKIVELGFKEESFSL